VVVGKIKWRMIDWRAGIDDWRPGPDLSRYQPGSGIPAAMQRSLETAGKFKLSRDTTIIQP
jgi:hypothetical protein